MLPVPACRVVQWGYSNRLVDLAIYVAKTDKAAGV